MALVKTELVNSSNKKKVVFLGKVLACEMVQGESSPCSGTLEGYMW